MSAQPSKTRQRLRWIIIQHVGDKVLPEDEEEYATVLLDKIKMSMSYYSNSTAIRDSFKVLYDELQECLNAVIVTEEMCDLPYYEQ